MQVSVFPSSPKQKFWFTGLKYPVNDRSFKWLWEGSLNEAVGEKFIVEASDDKPVVVYRALGRRVSIWSYDSSTSVKSPYTL